MRRIKLNLIIIATLFIAVACKENGDDEIASNDFYLALEQVNIDFLSIQVAHDPNEHLLFFYDPKFRKGITFNYLTRVEGTQGDININEQGYADIGYAYYKGNPEIYVPDSFYVDVYDMRNLAKVLSINTGHWVSGISVSGGIISVGYCDRSIETFARSNGQPIDAGDFGHLCEKIESSLYQDTLHVIGFPNGEYSFLVNKYTKEGKYIKSKVIETELLRRPFVRSSENGKFFLTSKEGYVYSFKGDYMGELPQGNSWRDFATSPNGEVIYALLYNGDVKRYSYPDLQEIGQAFIKEDDEKWIPERIFVDSENFIRVYQKFSGGGTNSSIHLSVTPLSEIAN